MKQEEYQLLLALPGICLFFAAVIYFSLRYRNKLTTKFLSSSFSELKAKLPENRRLATSFIYGVFQDFSASQAGYIVKNSEDQEIGRVTTKFSRIGWMGITCLGETYDVTPRIAWHQTRELRKSGSPTVLCTRIGKTVFRVVYEIPGVGTVEYSRLGFLSISDGVEVSFVSNGREIGFFFRSGSNQSCPRVVSLPSSVPLPVQMLMLVMA